MKDIFNKNDRYETWIDRETGLVIRRISKNASKTYFAGTDIIKSVNNIIEDYKYKIGNVTDEDVNVPDLSIYEIERKLIFSIIIKGDCISFFYKFL